MKNTIRAGVEFYFKGEKIVASMTFDLDKIMLSGGNLPDFYSLLATTNDLDTYSYQYEMMLAQPIVFDQAGGLAKGCLKEHHFDFIKFKRLWHGQQMQQQIAKIAQQYLAVDDLISHAELKQALVAAYLLGQNSKIH